MTGQTSSCRQDLSEELTSDLLRHARRRELRKSEQLYARASAPDALFWLEGGLIRLSVTSESGREAVLGLVTPEQWFGEASLFAREPRGNDADAVMDSTISVVPAAAVHRIVDQRPDYLLQFLSMIGQRYRDVLDRMDDTVLRPLPARLARVVLQSCERMLATLSPTYPIALRFSQEQAAAMVGASRQSVNRVLKQWEQQGVVQVGYRSLTVLDPGILQTLQHL